MRRIVKNSQPPALAKWRKKTAGTAWFNYEGLKQEPKLRETVIKALLKEQGGLCAYTGIAIDAATCHVEHVKAQDHCPAGSGDDVDYNNMVACFPQPNVGCPFGAVEKGSWPPPAEAKDFVSPLQVGCEGKFYYLYDGKIKARSSQAAEKTIEKLALDHKQLENYRRQAIRGALNKNGQLLTLKDAEATLATLARQTGKLDPFLFVVVNALQNHINQVNKKIR